MKIHEIHNSNENKEHLTLKLRPQVFQQKKETKKERERERERERQREMIYGFREKRRSELTMTLTTRHI